MLTAFSSRLSSLMRARSGAAALAAILIWALLFFALWQTTVDLSRTFAKNERELWYFFSSDTVGFGLMYTDLFREGFHWSGWHVSSAPEYPEMAWYFLMCALSGDPVKGHVLSALLQPLLLALALWFFYRALGPAQAKGAHVLAPFVATVVVLLFNRHRALDLLAFFWSLRHASTVIVALVSLGSLLRVLTSATRVAWTSLWLLTAIGAASDMLYLPIFTVPALGVVLCTLVLRQIPAGRALRLALGLVTASATGLLAFRLVTPSLTMGRMSEIDLTAVSQSFGRLASDFVAGRLRIIYALVVLAWLLLALAVVWRRTRRGGPPHPLALAALFGLLLFTVEGVALELTAKPLRVPGYTRYLLPVYTAALAGVGCATWAGLMRLTHGSCARASWLMVALLIGGQAAAWREAPPEAPAVFDYYPPVVRCLDDLALRYDLRYGVADYWLAKLTTALSRQGLRVQPVTSEVDPLPVYTNLEAFLGGVGAYRHDHPHYTFAVLGSLEAGGGIARERLLAWGPPRAVEQCAGFEVVVLSQSADAKIKRRFRANPTLRAYYRRHGYPLP